MSPSTFLCNTEPLVIRQVSFSVLVYLISLLLFLQTSSRWRGQALLFVQSSFIIASLKSHHDALETAVLKLLACRSRFQCCCHVNLARSSIITRALVDEWADEHVSHTTTTDSSRNKYVIRTFDYARFQASWRTSFNWEGICIVFSMAKEIAEFS